MVLNLFNKVKFLGHFQAKHHQNNNKKNNGTYRVFHSNIFRRIKGGGVESTFPPPQSLRFQKYFGPERVNTYSKPV